MTNEPKETAAQRRMKAFHKAQALIAAARETAKQKPPPVDDDA
ncbi:MULTISPECIES: hypothetical protein [unclassified Microbacterium]|nr:MULTISPECIES: hypothetical protein [unclassified Microbacterium]